MPLRTQSGKPPESVVFPSSFSMREGANIELARFRSCEKVVVKSCVFVIRSFVHSLSRAGKGYENIERVPGSDPFEVVVRKKAALCRRGREEKTGPKRPTVWESRMEKKKSQKKVCPGLRRARVGVHCCCTSYFVGRRFPVFYAENLPCCKCNQKPAQIPASMRWGGNACDRAGGVDGDFPRNNRRPLAKQ